MILYPAWPPSRDPVSCLTCGWLQANSGIDFVLQYYSCITGSTLLDHVRAAVLVSLVPRVCGYWEFEIQYEYEYHRVALSM